MLRKICILLTLMFTIVAITGDYHVTASNFNYGQTFYITPICVPSDPSMDLWEATLGSQGSYIKYGFSKSDFYLGYNGTYNTDKNFSYKADSVDYLKQLSIDHQLPIVVHLNGGHWTDGPITNYLFNHMDKVRFWDENNVPFPSIRKLWGAVLHFDVQIFYFPGILL
ncbi:MAG: hypothetical protein M1308_00755, partial [Actinobacteria bacterium]|nr:hypothetical protein [Actinomycetota bacterium]